MSVLTHEAKQKTNESEFQISRHDLRDAQASHNERRNLKTSWRLKLKIHSAPLLKFMFAHFTIEHQNKDTASRSPEP